MTQFEILETLAKLGAIIVNSHIVYTSGKHGDSYVNKDAVYPHTEITSSLCEVLARHYAAQSPDVVIAPAVGGVILSQWTAYHLSRLRGQEVFSIYAEKDPSSDAFLIKRGYDKFVKGKRVVVVEDVLNTGGSAKRVVEAVKSIGGDIVGVGALCNRGGVTHESLGAPELYSLVKVSLDAWDPGKCPLCKNNIPINTDVGKGREYLALSGTK